MTKLFFRVLVCFGLFGATLAYAEETVDIAPEIEFDEESEGLLNSLFSMNESAELKALHQVLQALEQGVVNNPTVSHQKALEHAKEVLTVLRHAQRDILGNDESSFALKMLADMIKGDNIVHEGDGHKAEVNAFFISSPNDGPVVSNLFVKVILKDEDEAHFYFDIGQGEIRRNNLHSVQRLANVDFVSDLPKDAFKRKFRSYMAGQSIKRRVVVHFVDAKGNNQSVEFDQVKWLKIKNLHLKNLRKVMKTYKLYLFGDKFKDGIKSQDFNDGLYMGGLQGLVLFTAMTLVSNMIPGMAVPTAAILGAAAMCISLGTFKGTFDNVIERLLRLSKRPSSVMTKDFAIGYLLSLVAIVGINIAQFATTDGIDGLSSRLELTSWMPFIALVGGKLIGALYAFPLHSLNLFKANSRDSSHVGMTKARKLFGRTVLKPIRKSRLSFFLIYWPFFLIGAIDPFVENGVYFETAFTEMLTAIGTMTHEYWLTGSATSASLNEALQQFEAGLFDPDTIKNLDEKAMTVSYPRIFGIFLAFGGYNTYLKLKFHREKKKAHATLADSEASNIDKLRAKKMLLAIGEAEHHSITRKMKSLLGAVAKSPKKAVKLAHRSCFSLFSRSETGDGNYDMADRYFFN